MSLDYARAEQRSLEQDRAVRQKLTVDLAKGTRRADVKALLAEKYAAHSVKEEGDTMFVDGVGLRFRGDQLVAVVFWTTETARAAPGREDPSRCHSFRTTTELRTSSFVKMLRSGHGTIDQSRGPGR
jgi:hypothetical protein